MKEGVSQNTPETENHIDMKALEEGVRLKKEQGRLEQWTDAYKTEASGYIRDMLRNNPDQLSRFLNESFERTSTKGWGFTGIPASEIQRKAMRRALIESGYTEQQLNSAAFETATSQSQLESYHRSVNTEGDRQAKINAEAQRRAELRNQLPKAEKEPEEFSVRGSYESFPLTVDNLADAAERSYAGIEPQMVTTYKERLAGLNPESRARDQERRMERFKERMATLIENIENPSSKPSIELGLKDMSSYLRAMNELTAETSQSAQPSEVAEEKTPDAEPTTTGGGLGARIGRSFRSMFGR